MLRHYRNLSNVTTITPTAVLELRGAFKNHPKQARERAGGPRPTEPLGDPPKRLKPVDKAAWREMQEHGFWLTSADQFMVEIAAPRSLLHCGPNMATQKWDDEAGRGGDAAGE
jgi:hypothetical protein